jgi:hypothetical protein
MVGVDRGTLGGWERGARHAAEEYLAAIEKSLRRRIKPG